MRRRAKVEPLARTVVQMARGRGRAAGATKKRRAKPRSTLGASRTMRRDVPGANNIISMTDLSHDYVGTETCAQSCGYAPTQV